MFFGWRVVYCAMVMSFFAIGIGFHGHSYLIYQLKLTKGWSETAIAAAFMEHFLLSAVVVSFLPELHRKFGLARTTILGGLLLTLGVGGYVFSENLWQLYMSAFISGLGFGTTNIAAVNEVVSVWFIRDRLRALNVAHNGMSLSAIIVVPAWIFASQAIGFKLASSLFCILVFAVITVGSYLYYRYTPQALGLNPDGLAELQERPNRCVSPMSKLQILKQSHFISLTAYVCLGLLSQAGLLCFLILILVPHFGPQWSAMFLSLAFVCSMLGRMAVNSFFANSNRRKIASLNIVMQAMGVVILATSSNVYSLVLAVVLFGLGIGNLILLPPLIIQNEFDNENVSTAVALVGSMSQVIFAFGPLIFASLTNLTSNFTYPLIFLMTVQLVAASIVLDWWQILKKRRTQLAA